MRSVSEKRRKRVKLRTNSTFASGVAPKAPQPLNPSLRKNEGGGTKSLARRNNAPRNSTLKKVNVARQAKRRAEYRKKLAAYRKSECYRDVEARAGGRCEDCTGIGCGNWGERCKVARPARLTHHHKTYARFGGTELPDDVIVLCDFHNAQWESQHPTRRRDYNQRETA